MENYLAKLMQFAPKSLNLDYAPKYSFQQQEGGDYYQSGGDMYDEERPLNLETYGGADKYGKSFGGALSGYIPTKKGSISGSASGMVSNYGKLTGQLTGAGLNYGNEKFSVGANYSTAPVQYQLMPDYYGNPSYQNGSLQPDFAGSEYFDNLYRQNSQSRPNQNFLVRGTFRY